MAKMLFILNPYSGKGQIKTHIFKITDAFTKMGFDVTVHPTQSGLDAYKYVSEHGNEFKRILISGGDGTLNEVVNGLMNIDSASRPQISYIPSGTTNDFASTLGIPKNLQKAVEFAMANGEMQCDVGRFNENKRIIDRVADDDTKKAMQILGENMKKIGYEVDQ